VIIGIDLGTTNSLVAAWDGEHARILPNALGNFLTPSVVGLDDEGQLVVGDIARDRLDEAAIYRRERLHARPQVQAGLAIGKFVKEPFDEQARRNMFGQAAKEMAGKS